MNYPQPPHPHHHHHRQQQQQPPPHPANSSHGGFSSFEDALQAHLKFNNEVLLQANATSNLNLPSSLVASSSSSSFTSTFTDQPLPSLTHSDQRSIKSHETQFIQSLTKTHNDIWTLPFVHDLNYLDSFDSTSYPVIYLFIISALLKSCMDGFLLIHSLFPRLMSFIRKVSSQTLHYAPSKVLELAELLFLVKDSLPISALVSPLLILTEKFAQPNSISCVHPIALKTCLLANHFKAAMRLLSSPMNQVQRPITCQDILLYMYYGGLIHTGMKNYKSAIQFFGFNLSLPSQYVSKIQIESFKRFTLLSLLLHGNLPSWVLNDSASIHGATSMVLKRALRTYCVDYIRYAENYPSLLLPPTQVRPTLPSYPSMFQQDGLLGLAKLTQSQWPILKLKQLTHTHVSVDVAALASTHHGSLETWTSLIIQAMVHQQIHGTLSGQHVLYFQLPQAPSFSSLLQLQLQNALEATHSLKDLAYQFQVDAMKSKSSSRVN